jgi:hypothetical protein
VQQAQRIDRGEQREMLSGGDALRHIRRITLRAGKQPKVRSPNSKHMAQ